VEYDMDRVEALDRLGFDEAWFGEHQMVADRWFLLDHLTRGRVMFGTGPGALPSDAYMMGTTRCGSGR
jgi:limonene 1,2-monooxygenase